MNWRKTSPYSIAAREGDYAVSRAVVLNVDTGELEDRFSAWCGPDLKDAPRGYMPELLGVRHSAAEAKALCKTHQGRGGFQTRPYGECQTRPTQAAPR